MNNAVKPFVFFEKRKNSKMKIPNRLIKISKKETRSLACRGLKLTEEAGELSAEILKYLGKKGRNGKTKEEVLAHLHLEAIDVMIMAMDILVHTNAREKEINDIMESQLKKWERKMPSERLT